MLPRPAAVRSCVRSVDKPQELVRRLWSSKGTLPAVRTARQMAVLRGKGMGLELALGGSEFDDALAELKGKLAERPGFYTGAAATAALGGSSLSEEQLAALTALLTQHGIGLEAISGGPHLEPLAEANGLRFAGGQLDDGGEELARRRALRPKREVQLSAAARSLVADFAGARADIASRRKSGEASVRRVIFSDPAAREAAQQKPPPASAEVPPAVVTLYHTGTLRGGQSLHNVGNIVVIGDVNPGAELVASGDIVVFGALRGVAHAGAQGDAQACVHAIELAPTQLRIATFIAAEPGNHARTARTGETARVQDDRIVIFPRGNAPA